VAPDEQLTIRFAEDHLKVTALGQEAEASSA
jgi:hypothetical protein